jgi:hypothetical protein
MSGIYDIIHERNYRRAPLALLMRYIIHVFDKIVDKIDNFYSQNWKTCPFWPKLQCSSDNRFHIPLV